MFSVIQEILVLVIIILAIFFLPRILSRGQDKQLAVQKSAVLSGKIRLAVTASVLWPAAIAAIMKPWQKNLIPYLYLGGGPVAVTWLIYWVWTGFKKK
jgi:hypothetical protein